MNNTADMKDPTLWSCIWYKEGGKPFSRQEILENVEQHLDDYHPDSKFRWWFFWLYLDIWDFFMCLDLIKMGKGPYKSLHSDARWGYWEYVFVFGIRNPIIHMCWSVLDFIKYKVLRMQYVDPHLGCYSYPNCDESPMGCRHVMGDEAEPYGHRD
jgi:hypothetical protein